MKYLALASLLALATPACSGTDEPTPPPPAQETGTSTGAVTVPTRLYAELGAHNLSFETLGTFEDRDGVRALVLRATANRYVSSVLSFVPDDAFGDAHVISERRFEIVLHEGHELNSVLSGLPLFILINTFTGTPTQYTARIEVTPQFFDFRGDDSIWVDSAVTPYYVHNGTDNLVYRGSAGVVADSLSVTAPDGAPAVSRVAADSFQLNWSYTTLHQAIDPHTVPLTFTAPRAGGTTASKTARLVARVVSLALTTGDAYDVWPEPGCVRPVYDCIHAQPAGTTDFSVCGKYRQVANCQYVTACEIHPLPQLTLSPIDGSSLEPARTAWNAGSNNGAWHSLSAMTTYSTPSCFTDPTPFQTIMAQLAANQGGPDVSAGTFTNRAGLSQNVFFNQSYGNGAALLSALDAFAGGGEVQAWISSQPESCQNCHQFGAQAVLYYPASHKVIVLSGHYGYDS
ncbi:hypothetical protein DRW03_09070 [Corallococcus sp. H22C18031201]|nr:hypothetical protein DRW03_09070 [Corallococcus sp. H22C18031201]